MTGRPGVTAEVIAAAAPAGAAPIDWEDAARLFADERWYWVATTGDESRPHLRPVLAVYLDERIYSTTSPVARKGRNLARRPSASLAARAPAVDIVIEGPVAWIDNRKRLQRVGDAYREKYGWPVTVTADSAFDAPYAAPTAGQPPTGSTSSLPPSHTPSGPATTSQNAPPGTASTIAQTDRLPRRVRASRALIVTGDRGRSADGSPLSWW
jgi:Pyridoxamine 5'-phosphate oxidase